MALIDGIKRKYTRFIDGVKGDLHRIQDATRKISSDISDMFLYNSTCVDSIAQKGKTLTDLGQDVEDAGKEMFSKMYAVKKDIGHLERLLWGKREQGKADENGYGSDEHHYGNMIHENISDDGKTVSEENRSSVFKSIFLSGIVGVESARYTYRHLREGHAPENHSKNNPKDNPGKHCEGSQDKGSGKSTWIEHSYSIRELNDIISIRNRYFWKDVCDLESLLGKKGNIGYDAGYACGKDGDMNIDMGGNIDMNQAIRYAMLMKVKDPRCGIMRINYDREIASKQMTDHVVYAYISSDRSLKGISCEFEKRYGMSISVSTISRYARKHLENNGIYVRNRKEAKSYFIEHGAAEQLWKAVNASELIA